MNGSWAVQWCPLLLDLRFLVLPWKIISLSIVNVITGWTCFNKKALNHSPEWLMFGRPPMHWAASLFPAVNPSWTPATHWPWTLAGSVPALRNTSAWFLYPLKLSCVLIQFIEQNILWPPCYLVSNQLKLIFTEHNLPSVWRRKQPRL